MKGIRGTKIGETGTTAAATESITQRDRDKIWMDKGDGCRVYNKRKIR